MSKEDHLRDEDLDAIFSTLGIESGTGTTPDRSIQRAPASSAALKYAQVVQPMPMRSHSASSTILKTFSKSEEERNIGKSDKVCSYFLKGTCRFGNACKFRHQLQSTCPYCKMDVDSSETIQQHFDVCEELKLMEEERMRSQHEECGICQELVKDTGGKFGILPGCAHVFCLHCIREWRGTITQQKEVTRQCPICRSESFFVVPSDRIISDPQRKAVLVDQYKNKTASIPCKWFDNGKGVCPFGTSCFYGHFNEDGSVAERSKLRHIESASGDVEIVRNVRLSDYFS